MKKKKKKIFFGDFETSFSYFKNWSLKTHTFCIIVKLVYLQDTCGIISEEYFLFCDTGDINLNQLMQFTCYLNLVKPTVKCLPLQIGQHWDLFKYELHHRKNLISFETIENKKNQFLKQCAHFNLK